MADSNPLIGILALVIIAVGVVVIVPAGPGNLTILTNEDYEQTWAEYEVDDPALDFSVGFGLLVLNLGLFLGMVSYSLLVYRSRENKARWQDPPDSDDGDDE